MTTEAEQNQRLYRALLRKEQAQADRAKAEQAEAEAQRDIDEAKAILAGLKLAEDANGGDPAE
jgi:hypothetical protein